MIVVALTLLLLHTVDDREVYINPAFVISTHEPQDKGGFDEKVNCIVSFIDAKFISVKETCSEVNSILYGSQ
jgi:hypothetical protein